jgi:hypothetical protein
MMKRAIVYFSAVGLLMLGLTSVLSSQEDKPSEIQAKFITCLEKNLEYNNHDCISILKSARKSDG